VLAPRVDDEAERRALVPARDEDRPGVSVSGSRQIGQFWMKRLWRQKVGTGAHPA
jgi:hypothetical protein